MRLAIVSDTHLGDELCGLLDGATAAVPAPGPAWPAFRRAVGRADWLVLLGDIIDLSVASYEDAFRAAQAFFRLVAADALAREAVYIPGNHDFEIWHTIEYEVNVIRPIEKGRVPRPFRRAVPGVLDDRPGGARKLVLPDVAAHPDRPPVGSDYGGLFLDRLAPLVFVFAYPNLYVVGEDGECVLVTHGHYFERYWTLLGDLAMRFAADDLGLEEPGRPSLRDVVGMNLPLNHLGSAGIGQAQPLTRLARTLQLEVLRGRTDHLEKYLDRMGHAALERWPWWLPFRPVEALVQRWVKRRILAAARRIEWARYSREFLKKDDVRDRFRRYYRASLAEIERLRREYGVSLPDPTSVVFGHTHQPIPWGSDELVHEVDGRTIRFSNTGGWLRRRLSGREDFPGAEVVLYETGRGFWSESIRGTDLKG
jgi:UDP-2,3-diacylglucosamine pyrophosphatase LpxH